MTRADSTKPARYSRGQQITLIALGLLAVVSVFLLPRLVTEPWLQGERGEQRAVVVAPSANEVSPSSAAELKKYRQDSQNVLAEVIVIRDRLREQQVELWGAADFERAMGQVETGDERYSFGEYEAALELYREALVGVTELAERGKRTLAEAREQGLAALEAGNVTVATSASELASAIAPDDAQVQELASRLETLPGVVEALRRGDQARERDQLEEAREAYRQAAALDPRHRRAAQALANAETALTEREFRRRMSRGFEAMERGDHAAARTAFRQAGEVFPGHADVQAALAHVANRESLNRVGQQVQGAAELEQREEWAQALTLYEALIEQDPSLAEVRARLVPVRVRAELDRRLESLLEDPLRLTDPKEYRKAEAALADARGLGAAGARLNDQVSRLEAAMAATRSVVDVVLRSDNQTQVVLYPVAELGRFQETSVRLRPGRYIAAGTRQGYRDVRVEFTITGQPVDDPIVVQCEEPI